MRFTKQDIYRLLGLEPSDVEPLVYHDVTGPGYLDSWLLLERNENIWQHFRDIPSYISKKQIIVCEPLEGRGPLSLFELQFFEALIAFCDVYFWPNNNQPFREARPISDTTEFWDNKCHQPFVTKQTIIESLVKEGLSLDNVMIIDFEAYRQITGRAPPLYVKSSTRKHLERTTQSALNISHVKPEQFQDLASCLNPLTIRTITTKPISADALRSLLNLFPNLDSLEIRHANAQWVLDHLHYLDDLNITLSHFMPESVFELPASTRLISLSISLHKRVVLNQLIAAKGACVNTLELRGLYNARLLLSELQGLRVFKLKESTLCFEENNPGNLDFMFPCLIVLPPKLETLSLDNVSIKHVRLSFNDYIASNPSLRSLVLHFSSIASSTVTLGQAQAPSRCLPCFNPSNNLLDSLETFSLNLNDINNRTSLLINLSSAVRLKRVCLPKDMNLDTFCLPENLEVTPVLLPLLIKVIKRDEYWGIHGEEFLNQYPAILNCSLRNQVFQLKDAVAQNRRHDISIPALDFEQVTSLTISNMVLRNELPEMTFKIIASKARFVHLDCLWVTANEDALTLDFSACPHLESLVIREAYAPLILNLKGLGAVRVLDIMTTRSLQINYDQGMLNHLEHLRLRADNAYMLRDLMAYGLAPGCVTHYYETNNHSFGLGSRVFNVICCRSYPVIQRTVLFFLIATLLCGVGFGVSLLIYYGFTSYYGLSNNDGDNYENTLPSTFTVTSQSLTTTTSRSTTVSSPTFTSSITHNGINAGSALEVWHLVLIVTAGAGLLSSLLVLLYCMRARLGCARQEPEGQTLTYADSGYQVDTNTGSANENKYVYPLTCNVYPDDGQRPEHVRLDIKNVLTYTQGKLIFSTSIEEMVRFYPPKYVLGKDSLMRHDLMQRVARDNNSLIYIKGPLAPGVFCPLPGWYPIEGEEDFLGLYIEEPELIDCYYHAGTQQVYITWSSEVRHPKQIHMFYEVRKKPLYLDQKNHGRLHQVNPQCLLTEIVRARIYKELQDHPALAFLFDETLSLENKIQALTVYFRSFKVSPLTRESDCQLGDLLNIIKESKGVCRHRSQGFMLLAHFLGCPVGVGLSRSHMYCVVPWQNDSFGWNYKRLDLSLVTGLFWEENIFWQIEEMVRENRSMALESIQIEDPHAQRYYANYYNHFKQYLTAKTLYSLEPLFHIRHASTPLIVLNGLSPYAFNTGLIQYLKSNGINTLSRHLFIDSPQAFLRYLKPYRIKAGQIIEKRNGPLRALLQAEQEQAVLLVDWTPFTSAQMASFQTLMDTPRMLFIEDEYFYLPDNLLVLGVIQDKTKAGLAFLSRMQRWDLSDTFARELRLSTEAVCPQLDKPVRKHVFSGPDWREALFGRLHLSPDGLAIEEGALSKAIRQGRSLLVYNPPKDPSFDLLRHKINEEKKYLNHQTGRMEAVPALVRIDTQTADENYLHNIIQTSRLRVYANNTGLPPGRRLIYLGLNNFHELYHGLRIDQHGQAHSLKGGLLALYEEGSDIFYLVGDIAKSRWESLLEHCWKRYQDKIFEFLLSPGSQIIGYEASNPAPAPESLLPTQLIDLNQRIYSSSDPDYFTQRLAASLPEPWVVYTHERTSFNDLIAVVYKEKQSVNRFVYERKAVLNALLDGRTVILSGHLSLELYLQLMSLCSDQPHIHSNGERLDLSGSLYLVLPEEQKNQLPFIQRHCAFSMVDYQLALPHVNFWHVQQIGAFYQGAHKLPHAGRGRPQQVRMNFARFTAFLAALEEGGAWHRHNPIKGLFIYDYPRRSEEQAYLNVLGKYYFTSNDRSPVRANKLAQLTITTLADLRRCVWTVLNCFHGEELRVILGPDLEEVVYPSGMPSLSAKALDFLFLLTQIEHPGTSQSERMGFEKTLERVRRFLQDPRQKVLMLKGPPGVGKTYAVRTLIGQYYEGKDNIEAWLSDRRDGVWLCDEANMLPPGTLDALIKGLCSGQKTILYQGQVYTQADSNKKMILTGNHESFPGRYYHPAIQDYAQTVYFEKPSDVFLHRHAQGILPQALHPFIPVLLLAYHLISQYNPYLPTSIRDMGSLARRFAHLYRLEPASVQQSLLRACVSEFACSIKEDDKRSAFIRRLEEITGQRYQLPYLEGDALIRLTQEISTTREKAYIIDTLLMNLHMRFETLVDEAARTCAQKDHGRGKGKNYFPSFFNPSTSAEHKRYLILQGEPGLGKSTLLRAVLSFYLEQLQARKTKGLEAALIERELGKTTYMASGDSSNAPMILTRALEEEAFVILDESNINPALETMLLQYLSGTDKPGFMVLGSENDGAQGGRLERSPAELNRSQLFYFPSYGPAEYLSFARAAKINYPEKFVKAFLDLSKENNEIGARHFFKCLKAEEKQLLSSISIELDSSSDSSDEEKPFLESDLGEQWNGQRT